MTTNELWVYENGRDYLQTALYDQPEEVANKYRSQGFIVDTPSKINALIRATEEKIYKLNKIRKITEKNITKC